jgi:hypothetical protein
MENDFLFDCFYKKITALLSSLTDSKAVIVINTCDFCYNWGKDESLITQITNETKATKISAIEPIIRYFSSFSCSLFIKPPSLYL